MADIRDPWAFLRGRCHWSQFGYEEGFPRGCGFSDLDARTGFDGKKLHIEAKHHDGVGSCDYPPTGELMELRDDAKDGRSVFVLYGCGQCNSPQALRIIGAKRSEDQWIDWRGSPVEVRRKNLKYEIDRAQGLLRPGS